MKWRQLLEKLGVLDPPVDALLAEATMRDGRLDRRTFLKLAGGAMAVAGMAPALDIDKILWQPKPQILVPDKTLVTAKTMTEAIGKALTAVWPNGYRADIQMADVPDPFNRTLEERVRQVIAEVEASGGRIISRVEWKASGSGRALVNDDIINAAVKDIRRGHDATLVTTATEDDLRKFTRDAIARNVATRVIR